MTAAAQTPPGGDGSAVSGPALGAPALPPPPGEATITISLSEINGVTQERPVTVTVNADEPLSKEPTEPQDDYGCCTGSQDSYS